MARLRNTWPSSPFGLHPYWDEGRVLHFRLEVGRVISVSDEVTLVKL